ncbi:LysM peptidoglycan-binding domain-containing protein [uncultured Cycloclasticus sp.]|uniref:LysM peptidoglycan-binding domain-containing protein n=1 Tax=uncultured Cycloclasticus sp. TaxID=172194 RepID=UPI00258AC305|nr:LysM peptidoglycan-binding domain-containing protein [uncultured Cycloclasticus sp.]
MQYLITNKSRLFFLFACVSVLVSCSLSPAKTTEKNTLISNNKAATGAVIRAKNKTKKAPATTPVAANDLWQRLFSLYQLPTVDNERIQAQIDWYSKHPDYFTRVQKNATPYLFHIVNEVEKRGIPGELALLPIVESAYKPFAYSHGRAAGLWQFIPSTGAAFGLEQTWWHDGRRDVYASTNAALTYLTKLSKRFDNDWFLALAGYNAGGGSVSSAIRKNKRLQRDTDYWALDLRKETKHYVPKLIAIAHILANAEEYNVTLLDIPNKPFFERVDTKKQIDLARAAELAEISIEELYVLNPAFNQWATNPTGPHYLLIPTAKSAEFKARLAALPDSQRLKWVRHKIKSGESLGQIAMRYRTTIKQIKQANPIKNNLIRAGKHLLIPTANYNNRLYASSADMRKSDIINTSRQGQKVEYYVQSGDSFWSIAKQYGVGVRSLAKWNAMAPRDTLRIGQKLVIWSQHPTHPSPRTQLASKRKNQTIRYTVKSGDSLYLISRKFNVSIIDLKRWNTLNKKYLKPGQKLKIIVDVTRT